MDAIVIGGGPAGSVTAIGLARAGWSVALVEKKSFPRRKVCGEFVSAANLPIMQTLGILDAYLAKAGPDVKRVGLFTKNTVLTADMPVHKNADHKWGCALGREHLDCLLLEEAVRAGAILWQPWTASNIVDHQTHHTCTLSTKDQSKDISARILILANGSWERSLPPKISRPHKPSDLLAFKAHFTHAALEEDLMPLLSFPGGYGGMVHTDNHRITLSCCVRRDKLEELRKNMHGLTAGDAVLKHIRSTCLGAKNVLSPAIRDGAWLSVGPLRPGIRSCYDNGIFYAGNIAGEVHPVVAEGISMAMQSGWLLSQTLLSQSNGLTTRQELDAIGQSYTKQWHHQFTNRMRTALCIANVSMRPAIMSLIVPILKRYPKLLTYGASLSGKIKLLPKQQASEKENAI